MTVDQEVYDLIDNAYDYVDEEFFNGEMVEEIRETMDGYHTPLEINELVVPQWFMTNYLTYESRTNPAPSGVSQTVQKLSGDCVDQSVLLATLYEIFGHQTRLRSIDKSNTVAPHMIVEVRSKWSADRVIPHAVEYYQDYTPLFPNTIEIHPYNSTPNESWYPVDPTGSSYIGDISGLRANGYIEYRQSASEPQTQWEYAELLLTEYPRDTKRGDESVGTQSEQTSSTKRTVNTSMSGIGFVCGQCEESNSFSATIDLQANAIEIQCDTCGFKEVLRDNQNNPDIYPYCYYCETYVGVDIDISSPRTIYMECNNCGNVDKL